MDVGIFDLWLPILLAAVLVFVASSVLHMVLPIHKGDYQKLPSEDAVLDGIRAHNVPPGQYLFPCPASMKDMGSPEMMEKYKRGPVGYAVVLPNGPMQMGKNLLQWFLFSVAIGVFVAYLTSRSLPAGAEYMKVFRFTGTIAFLGYGLTNVTDSIWKGVRWGTTVKFLFDGLIYALVTAGAFAGFWPAAA